METVPILVPVTIVGDKVHGPLVAATTILWWPAKKDPQRKE
jgi:hypothetical protein